VNLAVTVTTGGGVAVFRHAFSTLGSAILQAEVPATATSAGAISPTTVESVEAELPFLLAPGAELQEGDTGAQVTELQQRLSALGYWIGTPDGYFGDATVQAVYALEKAAGIARSGIVNDAFVAALNAGTVPTPRTTSGDAIEVDLERDLVLFVVNGSLKYTLNTSTGGGYTYVDAGVTSVAITPRGVYQIERVINGIDVDTLGVLWRPRFFTGGYAIHGDSYVPPYPDSHGCVRVSNEAINWIWANNLAPIGMKVWLY
jgi:peptidoglycan hydrolase-like protein with peptidoglycan-binding domain